MRAKFSGVCANTGKPYAAGTEIERGPNGWHIAGEKGPDIPADAIRVSKGEGYGGEPYEIGQVFRYSPRGAESQILYVLHGQYTYISGGPSQAHPERSPIRLHGDTVPVGKGQDIYGGGEWFVVDSDGAHIWRVTNNGRDGDDWAYNNIQTGGAGAIGLRFAATPERLAVIELLRQINAGREPV